MTMYCEGMRLQDAYIRTGHTNDLLQATDDLLDHQNAKKLHYLA